MSESEKAIGVFDSGIGGLTVVKRVIASLPNENIVYFGDTARVPYGSKSNSTVVEYSLQAAGFLMKKNVKMIVVACNTASSVALEALKESFNVPIVGVIEPGAKYALEKTKNFKIGVIGTHATINNKAYSKKIKMLAPKAEVYEKACPLFVPLAEEGWGNHPAALLIAEEYLKEMRESGIDILTLGCTHYPILTDAIQKTIGDSVELIDSGVAASTVVREELIKNGLLTNSKTPGRYEFYISDIFSKFKETAELFLGMPVDHINKVDLETLMEIKF